VPPGGACLSGNFPEFCHSVQFNLSNFLIPVPLFFHSIPLSHLLTIITLVKPSLTPNFLMLAKPQFQPYSTFPIVPFKFVPQIYLVHINTTLSHYLTLSQDFLTIRNNPESQNHQIQTQQTRIAWRKFITTRQFIRGTQKMGCNLRRLAVYRQAVPQGTQKYTKWVCATWRL